VVALACNSSTWDPESGGSNKFKAGLGYIGSLSPV
jgi:hypothetical protein